MEYFYITNTHDRKKLIYYSTLTTVRNFTWLWINHRIHKFCIGGDTFIYPARTRFEINWHLWNSGPPSAWRHNILFDFLLYIWECFSLQHTSRHISKLTMFFCLLTRLRIVHTKMLHEMPSQTKIMAFIIKSRKLQRRCVSLYPENSAGRLVEHIDFTYESWSKVIQF